MMRHRYVCVGLLCDYKPRLAIGLWSDADGTWYMNWSPDTSTTRVDCAFGSPADVPLGGIGSDWRNRSSAQPLSRMAFYRSSTWNGGGTLYQKDSLTTGCTGTQQTPVSFYAGMPRSRVFVVRDMTGDGLPELFYVNPDTASATWFSSPGYTNGTAVDLGDQRSILM